MGHVDLHLHITLDPIIVYHVHGRPPSSATGTRLAITAKGDPSMPATLTVDQSGKGTLEFTDDKGNVTTAPAGAIVTFTSSDTATATAAADPTDPFTVLVATVAPGGPVTITGSVTGVFEADGVTPFPDAIDTVNVTPGAAASDELQIVPVVPA